MENALPGRWLTRKCQVFPFYFLLGYIHHSVPLRAASSFESDWLTDTRMKKVVLLEAINSEN